MLKCKKLKADRKETSIRLRLTEDQKKILTAAAARTGLDLSGWLRFIALREAAL